MRAREERKRREEERKQRERGARAYVMDRVRDVGVEGVCAASAREARERG